MPRTKAEIEQMLLGGEKVGDIFLAKDEQKRLFAFLLERGNKSTGPFDEQYITDLKAAYLGNYKLPIPSEETASDTSGTKDSWRLVQIESEGFGGVNDFDGEPFSLEIDGESYILEGYNGQGKTSLISTIVWALTGHRLRSQEGPDTSVCEPQQLFDPINKSRKLRTWPPIVAYPRDKERLMTATPRVSVRLTFKNQGGKLASLERTLDGEEIRYQVDPMLVIPDLITEIGVLMPNRVPHIKVGQDGKLVDALIQLIGLEPLRILGEHVRALRHGSKNFTGVPKFSEVAKAKKEFYDALESASTSLKDRDHAPDVDLLKSVPLEKLESETESLIKSITDLKAEMLTSVSAEISDNIDITKASDQQRLQKAVYRLQSKLLGETLKSFPSVVLLSLLKKEREGGGLKKLFDTLHNVLADFERAKQLNERQFEDNRLRLKAAAAEWHLNNHPSSTTVDECPLCQRVFDESNLKDLGMEIQLLKSEAELLKKSYQEACSALEQKLSKDFPKQLIGKELSYKGDIRAWFIKDLENFLTKDEDLSGVLPKARDKILDKVNKMSASLPEILPCAYDNRLPDEDLDDDSSDFIKLCKRAQDFLHIDDWWKYAGEEFTKSRIEIFGERSEDGKFNENSLNSALENITAVVDLVKPFSDAAASLEKAKVAAKNWHSLDNEYKIRQEIKSALEPVSHLPDLVRDEADRTLSEVSESTCHIFNEIYFPKDLSLEEARIGKKRSLEVTGKLNDAVLLDATWIANISWLRAFLWSFLLALRKKYVERQGFNPLPLIVIDDPQSTFDSTHIQAWCNLFSRMGKGELDGFVKEQFIVASYDEYFMDKLESHGLPCRRASIEGMNAITGRLLIIEGNLLDRKWQKFDEDQSPAAAQEYIGTLREHVEGQLINMLHSFGVDPSNKTIGPMLDEFDSRKSQLPFSLPKVRQVIEAVRNNPSFTDILNQSHHKDRLRLGPADAIRTAQNWREIKDCMKDAFSEIRTFKYLGPRGQIHPVSKPPTIKVPDGFREVIKNVEFTVSAKAAALTDGRISVEVESDWSAERIIFPNHSAVRLNADTLSPVASIGDILIVRQFHEARDRDLVVAAISDRLYVRRLSNYPNSEDSVILSAQSSDPLVQMQPIIAQKDGSQIRIVDGVIYDKHNIPPIDEGNEAVELKGVSDLESLTKLTKVVYKVYGNSAVPLALDGQYLLVGDLIVDSEQVSRLDGRLVIATTEMLDGEVARFFKRMRWKPPLVVLESLDLGGKSPPEILSLDSDEKWPRLTSVSEVIGVIFSSQPEW